MNVVVCDDEQISCNAVAEAISAWAKASGWTDALVVRTFSSSENLHAAMKDGLFVDMLFLDIQIPGEMSGLELARQIRTTNSHVVIVFVTNYAEYACEGYSVDALRYLRKPIRQDQINECMNIAYRRWSLAQAENMVVTIKNNAIVLRYPDILYIEVRGHNLRIKTASNAQALEVRGQLRDIMATLPAELFVRCHRSFLVNLMYVRQLASKTLAMSDGALIPLGRKYDTAVADAFNHFYQGMSL